MGKEMVILGKKMVVSPKIHTFSSLRKKCFRSLFSCLSLSCRHNRHSSSTLWTLSIISLLCREQKTTCHPIVHRNEGRAPARSPLQGSDQETTSILSWNCCSPWDLQIPKIHRVINSQSSVPASCQGNLHQYPRDVRSSFPVDGNALFSRGVRSIPC